MSATTAYACCNASSWASLTAFRFSAVRWGEADPVSSSGAVWDQSLLLDSSGYELRKGVGRVLPAKAKKMIKASRMSFSSSRTFFSVICVISDDITTSLKVGLWCIRVCKASFFNYAKVLKSKIHTAEPPCNSYFILFKSSAETPASQLLYSSDGEKAGGRAGLSGSSMRRCLFNRRDV